MKFRAILAFELRYYLRRISTWVYFGIFFGLGFLLVNIAGGAIDSAAMVLGGGNQHVNSPMVITFVTVFVGFIGVLVTAALLGNAVYRDYETRIHPLFFTAPITKAEYLGGRFTGAFLINALILTGIPLGFMLGSPMPYLDAELFGPFRLDAYVQPFVVFVLPNLFLTAALFFTIAALTRQMLPNYLSGAGLFIGYLISSELYDRMDSRTLAGLIDPFGMTALSDLTKYWTPAQQNTQLIGLEGVVLWNRLLWIGVGLAVLVFLYLRFRFAHEGGRRGRRRGAGEPAAEVAPETPRAVVVPTAPREFGFAARARQTAAIARRSFWGIVGNRYFFAIAGAGLLFVFVVGTEVDSLYGTATWPVTYLVAEMLGGTFGLFMLILLSFYAGELIWRERDAGLDQVSDTVPVPDWVPFTGKFLALVGMLAVLQGVLMVACMAVQASKGYYDFEPGLYLQILFGIQLTNYVLLAALVMAIHVLVDHKYLGHVVVVLYYVFTLFAGQIGFEHRLYQYGSDLGTLYSDMNGFGPFLVPFGWFKLYWAAWALLLAVVGNLFWVRGREGGMRWRARLARQRLTRPVLSGIAVALVLITTFGGFIFYNTNVLNDYRSRFEGQELAAEYERLYERFEGVAQPRIVGSKLDVEIYPDEHDAEVRGTYRLVNRTAEPIDSVHLRILSRIDVRELGFDRPAAPVLSDERHGYYIYDLTTPLQPGDSATLRFDLAFESRGFPNSGVTTAVVRNGTFFNSGWLPGIGYDPKAELSSDDTRRKHGLEPKEHMAPATDLKALQNPYISSDADWIGFEAVVGTDDEQIAVAPGYLQREWVEDGRRYFHYTMDSPILNFYSFLSADYAVREDRWKDVAIQIFHHPEHTFNLDRMTQSVKASLDYFTANFGPYQHRQVRILEFPRYSTFAQAFPNTIPFSESIGFIARVKDEEEDIDYPFYVTAHEVAHQWWAHQVVGGNVQGATMLSETLAAYSALMVMEKTYGRDQIYRFLEHELDGYLMGRGTERKREVPLLRVENQGYIHYNKGAIAMYALRDYIGEERVNTALRRFLEEYRFGGPPYPSALDLYEELQAVTPDSLQYLLEDLFAEITIWDLRATEAIARSTAEDSVRVTLEVSALKAQADSIGNETEVPMNDLVDIGVFAAAEDGEGLGEPLYLRKHRIRSGAQTVTVTVAGEPARAGVDPYHKLIDRHTDDNTVEVGTSSDP